MTSQAFLMTLYVKSFDRKSEKECLTKRNIANFFLLALNLGESYCEFIQSIEGQKLCCQSNSRVSIKQIKFRPPNRQWWQ